MMLKKIKLKNIRSYKEHELKFSIGSTLLSGDVGSGKTSILLGIEFALFGLQPGQRGSSLLRNGETTGGVEIEFQVDDKEILIERTLKKSKTISQDYSAITINGEKQELSVTELKNKVLEILNYPKEFSRKQNILYKFTVYTPQEEMKQIILQDSETRINTLRHVFGIDKYKRILENASIVLLKIREEKKIKEILTLNFEQDKTNIITKENELEEKHLNLSSIERELFLKSEDRKKSQEEKQKIQEKIDEKTKLQQEIEKTKITISTKNDSISDNIKLIDQLKSQIFELQKVRFEESRIPEIENHILILKNQRYELSEKKLEISTQVNSLVIRNSDNEKTKEKLKHIEVCPTCLQDVDSVYKSNAINKIDSNISENINNLKELTLEKQKVFSDLDKLEFEISGKEKEMHELEILKIRLQGTKEKQENIEILEKSNSALVKDTEMLKNHSELLKNSIFELSRFDNMFEEKKRILEINLQEERSAEIKVAELKREIEVFSRNIEELKIKIEETAIIKKEFIRLSELESWLTKKFIPLILIVEKNVLIKLRLEFSKLFSKWFLMLVSESFNVHLDDNFTPIIEHQDYEIDYAYLSGGERTAVALAYRLALNQVINSMISKIKTKDLVILDEPTDGFSEQQLDKMREVLEQLNVAQLIIVSHEQKIEGFVENVIRLKKEDGVSSIEV